MPYAIVNRNVTGDSFLASLKPPRISVKKIDAIRLQNLAAAVNICRQLNESETRDIFGGCFFTSPID